ncbi:MAG: rhombosortase [Opitutales bacterium]
MPRGPLRALVSVRGRFPVVPVVVVLAAIGATLWEGAASLLLHQQGDLPEGRGWTLWTGHLVHFSTSHLLWDALAVLLLGALLERSAGALRVACLVLGAAPVVSLGVMACEPRLDGYGGLSGMACVLAGAVVGEWIRQGGPRRRLGLLLGAGLAAKLAWEALHPGAALLAAGWSGEVVPSVSAHALGALVGLAAAALPALTRPLGAGALVAGGAAGG